MRDSCWTSRLLSNVHSLVPNLVFLAVVNSFSKMLCIFDTGWPHAASQHIVRDWHGMEEPSHWKGKTFQKIRLTRWKWTHRFLTSLSTAPYSDVDKSAILKRHWDAWGHRAQRLEVSGDILRIASRTWHQHHLCILSRCCSAAAAPSLLWWRSHPNSSGSGLPRTALLSQFAHCG